MNENPTQNPESQSGETLYERLQRKLMEEQQGTPNLPHPQQNPQTPVYSTPASHSAFDSFSVEDDSPVAPLPYTSTHYIPQNEVPTPPPTAGPQPQPLPWERKTQSAPEPAPTPSLALPHNPSDVSQHRASFFQYVKSREFWLTLFGFCAVVGVLLSVFFYWVLPMLTLKGEARSVPRVVNLTLDEAIVQLENAGLQYRVDSQYDPNVPPFTVLQQDPRNMTRVKPGRTIALLVAKHRPPTVLLPRIVNVDVQQATYLLNSWGLRVGNLNYVAGNEPDIVKKAHFEGQLLEENAALLVGSRVDLTISRGQGKGKVKLPDVRGRSMMDAISILKQHGLDVQQPVRYTTRGSAPDGGRPTQGMVVLMDPAPGSVDSVRVGTVVELQVFGTGPEEVNEGTGDVTPPR